MQTLIVHRDDATDATTRKRPSSFPRTASLMIHVRENVPPQMRTLLTQSPSACLRFPEPPQEPPAVLPPRPQAWPRAGLLFSDPDSGDVLQLAVETALVLDGDDIARHPGARRLLRARVLCGWWRPAALPLRWSSAEFSPHLAAMAPAGQGKPQQD